LLRQVDGYINEDGGCLQQGHLELQFEVYRESVRLSLSYLSCTSSVKRIYRPDCPNMTPPFPSVTATWHNITYPAISPTQPHLSVAGKAVLITGGGRGIGAETARSFAAAGASLIGLTGRTSSPLESTKSAIEAEFPDTKVLVTVADVTDEAAMESAFSALSQANHGKGVDICIHNAGYLPNPNPIIKADTSDWWAGFTINILGSFIVTRAFLKHKNTAPSAEPVLVGVSTGAIALPPAPGYTAYSTSKSGQSIFFQALATEEKDIRIMQVHPGVIETDMGKKSIEGGMHLPLDDSKLHCTSSSEQLFAAHMV
jgi:NAD(P)-dependent dehydrogenase (short-subunit alcohol dehydrogenase family)